MSCLCLYENYWKPVSKISHLKLCILKELQKRNSDKHTISVTRLFLCTHLTNQYSKIDDASGTVSRSCIMIGTWKYSIKKPVLLNKKKNYWEQALIKNNIITLCINKYLKYNESQ